VLSISSAPSTTAHAPWPPK